MAVLKGDLRAKRASIDTGTGTRRVSDTGRAKHVGRGTFINWQDDLGISATEGAAKDIRAKDAQFKADIAERYKPIEEAEGKLSAAEQEVAKGYATVASDLDRLKAWYGWDTGKTGEQAKKQTVANVTSSLRLGNTAKSARDAESDEEFAARQAKVAASNAAIIKGYTDRPVSTYGDETGSWDPYRGSTQYKELGGGDKAKVRAALQSNLSTLEKNKEQLRAATASIGSQRGVLQGHRDVVKGYEDVDKAQWDKVHSDYKNRQETMKKLLGE